jgi:hypothetical protein
MKKKPDGPISSAAARDAISDHIAAFLKSGKTIQLIPTGQSGQDVLATRKHIRLGPTKT